MRASMFAQGKAAGAAVFERRQAHERLRKFSSTFRVSYRRRSMATRLFGGSSSKQPGEQRVAVRTKNRSACSPPVGCRARETNRANCSAAESERVVRSAPCRRSVLEALPAWLRSGVALLASTINAKAKKCDRAFGRAAPFVCGLFSVLARLAVRAFLPRRRLLRLILRVPISLSVCIIRHSTCRASITLELCLCVATWQSHHDAHQPQMKPTDSRQQQHLQATASFPPSARRPT